MSKLTRRTALGALAGAVAAPSGARAQTTRWRMATSWPRNLPGPGISAQRLAERIRDAVPSVRIESHCGGGSFKSQLKRADKSGAQLALILGDAETERRVIGLKSLRAEAPQVELAWDRVAAEIAARLGR